MLDGLANPRGGPQMSGITHTQSQAAARSHSARLRVALVVAALVAACALAAVLAFATGDDDPRLSNAPQPAAVEPATIAAPGTRYDGGPEEGSWRVAPNPGRPDGGPDEGTRGPGH
jgi:hypothetical protein